MENANVYICTYSINSIHGECIIMRKLAWDYGRSIRIRVMGMGTSDHCFHGSKRPLLFFTCPHVNDRTIALARSEEGAVSRLTIALPVHRLLVTCSTQISPVKCYTYIYKMLLLSYHVSLRTSLLLYVSRLHDEAHETRNNCTLCWIAVIVV